MGAPDLPSEIIDYILEYLINENDVVSAGWLRNASLIDSHFRARAQRLLFQRLCFSFRDHNLIRLHSTLRANPLLATYVREIFASDLDDRRYDHKSKDSSISKRRDALMDTIDILGPENVTMLTLRRNSLHYNGPSPSPFLVLLADHAFSTFSNLQSVQLYKALDFDCAPLLHLESLRCLELLEVEPLYTIAKLPTREVSQGARLERLVMTGLSSLAGFLGIGFYFNLEHLKEFSMEMGTSRLHKASLESVLMHCQNSLKTLVLRIVFNQIGLDYEPLQRGHALEHIYIAYTHGMHYGERFSMAFLDRLHPPPSLRRLSFAVASEDHRCDITHLYPPDTHAQLERVFSGRNTSKWKNLKEIDFRFMEEPGRLSPLPLPKIPLELGWFERAAEMGIKVSVLETEVIPTLQWPYYVSATRGEGEIIGEG